MKQGLLGALLGGAALLALGAGAQAGSDGVQNDNLNATLWTQTAVEFKGNAITAYRAAHTALDAALKDPNWTAAPAEQGADYATKPVAVILDVDETVLDNSGYQAWMVKNGESFNPKTWGAYVNTETSRAVPGALDFITYAKSRGVQVFYVSNRTADLETATRNNLKALGFPIDSREDTVLLKKERDDWGSKKGTRRAVVAENYRIALLIGDNLGDFVDAYKGSVGDRDQVFADNLDKWGRQWIVVANPTYGSWESAPFGHDYKKSDAEKRGGKLDALSNWDGK